MIELGHHCRGSHCLDTVALTSRQAAQAGLESGPDRGQREIGFIGPVQFLRKRDSLDNFSSLDDCGQRLFHALGNVGAACSLKMSRRIPNERTINRLGPSSKMHFMPGRALDPHIDKWVPSNKTLSKNRQHLPHPRNEPGYQGLRRRVALFPSSGHGLFGSWSVPRRPAPRR